MSQIEEPIVIDAEDEVRYIADKTGIDIETILTVIEAQTDYLTEVGVYQTNE